MFLVRLALSLVGAGALYVIWMALAIPGSRLSQPGIGVVLLILAPVFTATGFALGTLVGQRVTGKDSSGFVRAWVWPLVGCAIGASAVYPFGPMLIVFGMFVLGAAGVAVGELVVRRTSAPSN